MTSKCRLLRAPCPSTHMASLLALLSAGPPSLPRVLGDPSRASLRRAVLPLLPAVAGLGQHTP